MEAAAKPKKIEKFTICKISLVMMLQKCFGNNMLNKIFKDIF
jgi:hypothetical protein